MSNSKIQKNPALKESILSFMAHQKWPIEPASLIEIHSFNADSVRAAIWDLLSEGKLELTWTRRLRLPRTVKSKNV